MNISQQCPINIEYKGQCVGEYYADIIVNNSVIVELKTVANLEEIHSAQLINYLKATGIKVGLLINFAKPKIEIKRMVNKFVLK